MRVTGYNIRIQKVQQRCRSPYFTSLDLKEKVNYIHTYKCLHVLYLQFIIGLFKFMIQKVKHFNHSYNTDSLFLLLTIILKEFHLFLSGPVGKLMNNMMRLIKFLFFGTLSIVKSRKSESVL